MKWFHRYVQFSEIPQNKIHSFNTFCSHSAHANPIYARMRQG